MKGLNFRKMYKIQLRKDTLPKGSIMGIVLLMSPLIIFLFNFPIYKTLFLMMVWHVIITLPLLNALSKFYSWKNIANDTKMPFRSKKHPFYLLTIALGIIYPFIWGFFLSLTRYFRLGMSYNIFSSLIPWLDYLILVIFIFPNLLIWGYVFIDIVKQIKAILWQYTESFIFSLHLSALQYYDYFFICRLIHKSHFVLYDFITQYPGSFYRCFDDTMKKPFLIQFAIKIRSPYFYLSIHIIMISIIIFEIILNQGYIYWSLYILFIYPFLWGTINIYHIIGKQNLVYNMCLSDYLHLNFKSPRYHMKFWFLMRNPVLWYNFKHELPEELLTLVIQTQQQEALKYSQYIHLHNKLSYYIHGYKALPSYIRKLTPKKYGVKIRSAQPLGIRIAANYKIIYGVRWLHTTRVLYSPPNVLHPFTTKFIKDPYMILALLNKPGQNFAQIQQLANKISHWPKPNDLYKPHTNIKLDYPKTLNDVLEANLVMRFNSLTTNGVILGTYHHMKTKYGYEKLETMQMRPDMVSIWIYNTVHLYKGYLGLDEKHKVDSATNQGRHQIINSIEKEDYIELLTHFENKLAEKNKLTDEMRAVLSDLKQATLDYNFENLLEIWADNLHVFPDKWKPPLMIEKTFDESNLTPEAIEKIRRGDAYIQKISNQLYVLEATQKKGELTEEALDIFNESIIQKIMDSEN